MSVFCPSHRVSEMDGNSHNGYRILLIEDNPDHQLLERKALEGLGPATQVFAAVTADDGLEALRSQKFDLVIADYRMPGMDGLEFLRVVREKHFAVPIVVVTGLGNERVAVEALKQGAQDYLIKETGYLNLLPSVAERTIATCRARRQLEEARIRLAESEEQYRALVENSPLAIVVHDAQGRAQMCNPAFERLFMYSQEEIVGEILDELLAPEELTSEAVDLTQRTVAGEIVYATTHRKRRDGTLVDVEVHGVPLMQDGKLVRGYGLYQDITERKRAAEENQRLQEQLLQAQKMESIGTLAGGIAHDFNNLLQGILGYTSLSLQCVDSQSETHRFLQAVFESAERAANLTSQMLAFSRRKEPRVEPVGISRLVDETVRMLRHMIPTTIEIENRIEPNAWPVEADATQIQQVLVNVCVNARDAMPGGGTLTLETKNRVISQAEAERHVGVAAGRYVMLTVSDTGIGMTAALRERIFEPFFTTKGVGEGTGLGLAVAYGIVRSHRGRITVYSEPGKGSVFHIYLPAASKEAVVEERTLEPVSGGSETILVVDDEPVVLDLACDILRVYGYRTLTAHDGEEAIGVYEDRTTEIDLVLLDLTMPKLGGVDCASKLKALNPDVRLIASSGYSAHAKDMLTDRVNAFVPKPYGPEELARTVRSVLDDPNHPAHLVGQHSQVL